MLKRPMSWRGFADVQSAVYYLSRPCTSVRLDRTAYKVAYFTLHCVMCFCTLSRAEIQPAVTGRVCLVSRATKREGYEEIFIRFS